MNADETFLTTADLADRWGMAQQTLETWRMRGEGPPFVKLGKGTRAPVRYRLADVRDYEEQNRAG